MRTVVCTVCGDQVSQIDLRASFGGDQFGLPAQELAVGLAEGNLHVISEHAAVSLLRLRKALPLDPLVKVSEFNPLDRSSRIESTSRVRR